jgi:putative transposase
VLEVDRSTFHYKSRRADQAGLETRIKEICATRVRYGYRRVHVVLQRDGWNVNIKRVYRIYKELGLQLRNKTPKRRVKAKLRDDRTPATRPNETWAMDFVHDQLATGKKIRVLTVVDTFSRYSPVIDPRFSYRAENVVQMLDQACDGAGLSKDNQGRSRLRICLARSRPLGLCQRCYPGLLPPRKANRQRVY